MRITLVAIIAWVGLLKFSAYEAAAIQPLVEQSPLLSWTLDIFNIRDFARILGTGEVIVAALILMRYIAPIAAVVGSALAVVLFAMTTTFLFTTPGVMQPGTSFELSPMIGQFLIKDVALLAISLWSLGEAWRAVRAQRSVHTTY